MPRLLLPLAVAVAVATACTDAAPTQPITPHTRDTVVVTRTRVDTVFRVDTVIRKLELVILRVDTLYLCR